MPDLLNLWLIDSDSKAAEAIVTALGNQGLVLRVRVIAKPQDISASLASNPPQAILCQRDMLTALMTLLREGTLASLASCPIIALSQNAASQDENALAAALTVGARDLVPASTPKHLAAVITREIALAGLHSQLNEITQRAKYAELACQTILQYTSDAVALIKDGVHVQVNASYAQKFSYETPAEMEGLPFMDLVGAADRETLKKQIKAILRGEAPLAPSELSMQGKNGSTLSLRPCFTTLRIDTEQALLVFIPLAGAATGTQAAQTTKPVMMSITAYLQASAERLRANTTQRLFTFLVMRLINLEQRLTQLGYIESEALLERSLTRLLSILPANTLWTKLREDRLTVLMDMDPGTEPMAEAKKLIGHYTGSDQETAPLIITAGLRMIGENQNVDSLLAQAEQTATTDASEENPVVIYRPSATQSGGDNKDNADFIKRAFQENRFRMAFLPIVALDGSPADRYAIRLRMLDLQDKEIQPDEFLPAAEQAGLMPTIDRWVVQQALSFLHNRQGHQPTLFIKFSEATILDESFVPWLLPQINQVTAKKIQVEIDQEALERNMKLARELIGQLRQVGCGIMLDHFGCHPDSIRLLDHLTLDYIKLDKKFLAELETKECQEELQQIIQKATEKNIQTMMGKVNRAEHMAILWNVGAGFVQGDYLQESEMVLGTQTEPTEPL